MRPCFLLAFAAVTLGALGCHSAYVEADIRNASSQPISLVELDYPSASFGVQSLLPGQEYHYRFKILGSGALKLVYTDAANKEVHVDGPAVNEGDEGFLSVAVTPGGVRWEPKLKQH